MSKDSLEIRAFRPGDLDELQAIRARAFVPVFQSFRKILGTRIAGVALSNAEKEQEKVLAESCAGDTSQQILVACREGRPVGFATFSLDHDRKIGEIGLNAVDPAHAGQGIGTELYLFALKEMKSAGMEVATVGTGGDASHAPARRAYEKAGFSAMLPSQWLYREL